MLCSDGLDSTVLVAQQARNAQVLPVYVRSGLAWETMEELSLSKLLTVPPFVGQTEPLVHLETTIRNLYEPSHWAVQGTPPAFGAPHSDTYLAGRNATHLAEV